jgi:hypothetical protein
MVRDLKDMYRVVRAIIKREDGPSRQDQGEDHRVREIAEVPEAPKRMYVEAPLGAEAHHM